MDLNRIIILLLIFSGSISMSSAQTHRYIVHFSDKDNSPFSIASPEAFLSQRSIDRRANQGIAVDESDLPVNPAYIQSIKDLGVEVYFSSKWLNAALIQTDMNNLAAIEGLAFVDSVEFVAKGAKLTMGNENVDTSGGTPILGTNTNNRRTDLQNEMIGVDIMHAEGYFGEGMLVAVLDGGYRKVNLSSFFEHLFLNDQIVYAYDLIRNEKDVYAYSSHGTRVLSCLSAQHEDSFVGVVPNADYALIITEDPGTEYRIEEYTLVIGAEKADSLGADVINASVGYNVFDTAFMNYSYQQMDGNTTIAAKGMNMASSKGMVIATSAGNDGNSGTWPWIVTPADSPGALTVGAVDVAGVRVSFSSIGPSSDGRIKPDLMSVGAGTVVCTETANITVSNGTSFSSPQIAGLATGLWQANPELTSIEIMDRLRSTASVGSNPDNLQGYGVPDFQRANENTVVGFEDELYEDIRIYPNPIEDNQLIVQSEAGLLNGAELSLYSSNGQRIKSIKTSGRKNKIVLRVDTFQKGLYILRVSKEGTGRSYRVLKF